MEQDKKILIDKQRIKQIAIIFLGGISFAALLLFILAASSRYDVLVKETDGSFYRGRALVVIGPVVVCSRDSSTFTTRAAALQAKDPDYTLSVFSMNRVQFIEVTGGQEEGGPGLGAWQPTLKDFIGDYQLNAAGNRGYMSLRASGEYLYGTVRFPEWGRGVTEYLKNVRLAGGKLYFTRSVTSAQELRRIGANAPFVQHYSGEYFRSGNLIKGYYIIQGERKYWEAVKIR